MYNIIIIIGILVSLLFTEITNLSAGIIIPGYLALSISEPVRMIWTFVVAFISYVVCKMLSNFIILYGRRKFAIMIIISFLISYFLLKDKNVIGILIPGIIAREIDRQGILYTMISLVITTSLIVLIMFIIGYPVFR